MQWGIKEICNSPELALADQSSRLAYARKKDLYVIPRERRSITWTNCTRTYDYDYTQKEHVRTHQEFPSPQNLERVRKLQSNAYHPRNQRRHRWEDESGNEARTQYFSKVVGRKSRNSTDKKA